MATKIRSILGCVLGFLAGTVLAGFFTMELGPLIAGEAFRNLGGLYLLLSIPIGAGFGGGLGFYWGQRHATSFLGVFLPLCSAVGFFAFREYQKVGMTDPVEMQLVLKAEKLNWMAGNVAEGHPFEGVVVADGVETPVSGTVPAELHFHAKTLRYMLTLKEVPGRENEWFTCRLRVNGREAAGFHSHFGVSGQITTKGVGRWFNFWHSGSVVQPRKPIPVVADFAEPPP